MANSPLFLGIDIGTGGVRCLAVTAEGEVVARSAATLALPSKARQGTEHEQDVDGWWGALTTATRELIAHLSRKGLDATSITAVSIDGTSGTAVFLDADGRPARPAMMYNDGRAVEEAAQLNTLGAELCAKLGYNFSPSFGLAKILWVRRHEPEIFARTRWIMHQSDYLEARLTGEFGVSDFSNALKTGYDLVENRWPDWLAEDVAVRLPRVVAPGQIIGQVSATASQATGLPAGLPVAAGATDGTAGFLASGVRQVGDYNATLGTTLVFKGLSRQLHRHPQGLIYSHKLPGAGAGAGGSGCLWLPGAASNAGCEWIGQKFPGADVKALDAAAAQLLPSPHLAYPLVAKGERFPFLNVEARGFCTPEAAGEALYAANLQGIAMLERLGYETLDRVMAGEIQPPQRGGGQPGPQARGEIFSTGGGSQSDVWMQCRADVTSRVIHRPACPESAFGAAILAAGACLGDVWQAIDKMIHIEKSFVPRANLAGAYDDLYGRFLAELKQRGYL